MAILLNGGFIRTSQGKILLLFLVKNYGLLFANATKLFGKAVAAARLLLLASSVRLYLLNIGMKKIPILKMITPMPFSEEMGRAVMSLQNVSLSFMRPSKKANQEFLPIR